MTGELLVFAIIGVGALAFAAVIFAPHYLIRDYKGTTEQQEHADEVRKTAAQVIGILIVIATAGWAVYKDNKTLVYSTNQAIIGQYTTSVQLLDEKNGEIIQAGALYTLGAIAQNNEEYSPQAYSTIIAFLNRAHQDDPELPVGLMAHGAVDAAVQVLGKRTPVAGNCPDISELHPLGLKFSNADLAAANFRELQGFRCGDFQNARLYGAKMQGANLEGALFDGAQMADFDAYGSGWEKNPRGLQWFAWKRLRYVVDFTGANLRNARFKDTSVSGAIFDNADLEGTQFINVKLSRASFLGAKNIDKATFKDCCYTDLPELDAGVKIKVSRTCPGL